MTIEFWPRSMLRPKPRRPLKPKVHRAARPKLPVRVGQAHQKLTQAIICGDHELASWLDWAVKSGNVTGQPSDIQHLKERLNAALAPLDEPQRSANPS